MQHPETNEQDLDRLSTYQNMAKHAVRAWSVYITYYAIAIVLVIITTHKSFETLSGFLLDLAEDPIFWFVVIMPPLLVFYLRWSVMELATRLHNVDSEYVPLDESLFSDADGFSETTHAGETFDLHRLLNEIVEAHASTAGDKNIHFSADIHNDVPTSVVGQSLILKTVLNELLTSAVSRTELGEIYVSTKVLEESHGELLTRFEVGDSGSGDGISNSHMHHYGELLASVGGQISEHTKRGSGQTVWFTMMLHKEYKQTAAA